MLIDGYWLQIQDSRMQPRHCANYRPTDTLSIEWWQTGWLLSGNKDRAFSAILWPDNLNSRFFRLLEIFESSHYYHKVIINEWRLKRMQHDSLYSVACFSDCCWKDTHEACGCWWPRTRQTGVFFSAWPAPFLFLFRRGCLLQPILIPSVFRERNTHMQMSSKHEIAYLVQDWIFAKKKHHQRTQDRLPDLLRQNLFFFSWFRLGVGWLSISLFRLRRSFTRRSDMVWHSPPHTSWWSLRLLLGRLLLRRRFRWCLCLHHVLSDDSQIFARHNLKQMLSFAARSVRLIACSWMHMWTVLTLS